MYRKGDRYITKPGRTYFFIFYPGLPDGIFTKAIETYCNALINTNGGILVFGVNQSERVCGFELTRREEDVYKLHFDRAIRQMRPTIHPHQYRLDVIYLQYCPLALFEIRMSAGEPEEIYENSKHEMFIVKEKKLYGPLFPCEITQIVLAKYKEELSALIIENNQSLKQVTTQAHNQHDNKTSQEDKASSKEDKENEMTQAAKKPKINKVTWP